MLKLIILAVVGYVFYRALKSWMTPGTEHPLEGRSQGAVEVDDVLVQDPVCKTYIAQRSAIPLKTDEKTIYFCSEACRDRYLESRSNEYRS